MAFHYDPTADPDYIDRDAAADWRRQLRDDDEFDSLMRSLPGEDHAPEIDPRIIHLGRHLGPTWQRELTADYLANGGWHIESVSTNAKPKRDSVLVAIVFLWRSLGPALDQVVPARRGKPTREQAAALRLLEVGIFHLDALGFTSRALEGATARKRGSVWRLRQRGAATLRAA
jgi:hypothetical protein